MAGAERWYFTKEHLATTPSRKSGVDSDKELSNRQQAANFIQDMGQRLQVTQLCINTAIVYMHRFYVFHSFEKFHRNAISTCALFLAAKIEEQPRKLEHVIRVAHVCLHRDTKQLDTKSEAYAEQAHQLVINENIMLQTLGFDIAIDHPHTYVVKCCQLVRASKDLAQTSYFMATNSLHLTTMCLQYRPTVVACVCIHLACKWSNWEIPKSSEGKEWFWYVDKSVSLQLLEELTSDFLAILDKCPSRLKRKIMSGNAKESQLPLDKKGKSDIMLNIGASSSLSMADHDKELESLLEASRAEFPELSTLASSSPVPTKAAPPSQVSPSKKQRVDGHSISLQAYRDKKEKTRHDQKPKQHDLANSHGSVNNSKHQISSIVTTEERHNKVHGSGEASVPRLESSPQLVDAQMDSFISGKFQKPMSISELFPDENMAPPKKVPSPQPPPVVSYVPPVVPAPKIKEEVPSEHKANKSRHSQPKTPPVAAPQEKAPRSHRRKSPANAALPKTEHPDVHRPTQSNPPANKHERKEKHNRPQSSEKGSMHKTSSMAGGSLKITIPKDKIILKPEAHGSKVEPAPSQLLVTDKSPREALKLKIPKHKISAPPQQQAQLPSEPKSVTNCNSSSGTGLKLVITKDRLNSGTYSTSKKCDSRKREGERTTEHSRNKIPRVSSQQQQQSRRHHTNDNAHQRKDS